MIRFDRLFSALFIVIIVMINLSNAAEKSETVRLGCADDLNQAALDVVKKAVKDYWVREKAWDAAKSLEEALILEPRLHLGYDILKIHYCFHQKKCAQAVTLLKKAVKYCPDYYGHNYGLAEVYVKMGAHTQALENYAISLEKGAPETAYFYFKIAESQFAIRKMERAIFYLRKSIKLDELYFPARRNLITLLYKTQRKQEAISQAQKLIALKPDDKLLKWAKTVIEKMSR